MARTLVIGDTHAPFTHRYYLEFCQRIRDKYRCDRIIHIGDEVDNHALSFHTSETDAVGPAMEAELAQDELYRWYGEFPKVDVCLGNHSRLPERKAKEASIPSKFLKSYADMWDSPKGWRWAMDWRVDGTLYTHGTLCGKTAHVRLAESNRCSAVQGHTHCFGGVQYLASKHDLIFGMNVGCGIDIEAYSFRYGRDFANRPTLGCGVVVDGVEAYFEPMLFKNKRLRRPQIVVPKGGK